MLDLQPVGAKCDGNAHRLVVNVPGNALQALGAVVDGVKSGHHGQQRLGCANVRGGLLPADVLLAGLKGQAVGLGALDIARNTHNAARHLAGQPGGDRHEPGVGPAEE